MTTDPSVFPTFSFSFTPDHTKNEFLKNSNSNFVFVVIDIIHQKHNIDLTNQIFPKYGINLIQTNTDHYKFKYSGAEPLTKETVSKFQINDHNCMISRNDFINSVNEYFHNYIWYPFYIETTKKHEEHVNEICKKYNVTYIKRPYPKNGAYTLINGQRIELNEDSFRSIITWLPEKASRDIMSLKLTALENDLHISKHELKDHVSIFCPLSVTNSSGITTSTT